MAIKKLSIFVFLLTMLNNIPAYSMVEEEPEEQELSKIQKELFNLTSLIGEISQILLDGEHPVEAIKIFNEFLASRGLTVEKIGYLYHCLKKYNKDDYNKSPIFTDPIYFKPKSLPK